MHRTPVGDLERPGTLLLGKVPVQGDLSEEQRGKALEIADKCPVHRTLTSEINIRTQLV